MSTPGPSIKESRDDVSTEERIRRGALRRMSIRLTDGGTWQMVGHTMLGGDPEVRKVEMFSGIGFASRPAAGANAEGLVAFVGGSSNPISVAARDEDLRRKVAAIDQNESIMFNTAVIAVCKKTGQMWICAPGAAPVGVALASELNDLRAFVMQQFSGTPGHTHTVSGAATTTTVPVVTPVTAPSGVYPGSQVLKTQ